MIKFHVISLMDITPQLGIWVTQVAQAHKTQIVKMNHIQLN